MLIHIIIIIIVVFFLGIAFDETLAENIFLRQVSILSIPMVSDWSNISAVCLKLGLIIQIIGLILDILVWIERNRLIFINWLVVE